MKLILFTMLIFAGGVHAQNLKCAVKYQGQTSPMLWFAGNQTHHAPAALDTLAVTVKERPSGDQFEVTVVEMVDDNVWQKFSSIVDAAGLDPLTRTKMRALGRTRVTRAYVGLYDGLLHFEHRLSDDPNVYEVSCSKIGQ